MSDATFDPLDQELQNIYTCLSQPTEKLWISWPVTDLMGSQLRPSFVVGRIRTLFPQVCINVDDGSYRYLVADSALELAGQDPEGPLWQHFSNDPDYDLTLEAMNRARTLSAGKLSRDAVRTLYGDNIRMSASRMDRLKRCHFSYFMQYGLKAKERKRAGFDAPQIGTFIHYLLENVTRDVMGRGGYGAVEEKELRQMVKYYVDQYAQLGIDHYHDKSARFRYLFSRLQKTAYSIIENIARELENSDFKPLSVELSFGGKDGELPEITIQEGNTNLSVSGKVDRVDGWLKDGKLYLRVVDYKTGQQKLNLAELHYGLGIQMLLYLFALRDKGSSYYKHPIEPAGVLYLPAREEILDLNRDVSEEKLQKEMDKALQRSGMILSDPEVLQAMEHDALVSPCFLPIKVSKKNGDIKGSLATAAQLGKLGKYVEHLLHQITRELVSGNIDTDPCGEDPRKNACTYCAFAPSCYFRAGQGNDQIRYLGKVTDEEFWQHVDQSVAKEENSGED